MIGRFKVFDPVGDPYPEKPPIPMRQRQYLAGSSRPGFPTHLRYAGPDDLLAFSLTDELADLDRVMDGIRQLVEEQLATTGALLIRGLSRPGPGLVNEKKSVDCVLVCVSLSRIHF